VLEHGLPGAMAAAAGVGEQSLWAAGVWGPDFLQGFQEVQFCGTAACLGEPNLWVAEVWGPDFPYRLQEVQSHGAAAALGEQSPWAVGAPQSNLPHGLQGAQFYGTVARETEPAGLCLLLPMEQQKPWDLLTQGHWFPWHFRVKVAAPILRGNMEL
jgi:hypothetical protein